MNNLAGTPQEPHLAVGEEANPPALDVGERRFESCQPDLRGGGAAVLASLMSSRPWVRILPAPLWPWCKWQALGVVTPAAPVQVRPATPLTPAVSTADQWRRAASACAASVVIAVKNAGDCPRNSPIAVRNLTTAIAIPFVSVGRTIEKTGNLRERKFVGSGMIRLVWKSCPPNGFLLRSGNTRPFVGSVNGGAFPALSLQVWK